MHPFARWLADIRFRWLPPQRLCVPEHLTYLHKHPRFFTLLEGTNTVLPGGWRRYLSLLGIGNIPRMSTLAVGAVVREAVRNMPADQAYVNVGCWHGFTLLSGMLDNPGKRCIGVDDFSQFGGPREQFLRRFDKRKSPLHAFFEMADRDYFARRHTERIGVYFFDGDHSEESQMHGLKMAEPFFAPGCIIIIDDWNWPDPKRGTQRFLQSSEFSYDTLFQVGTAQNIHPTWWNGLCVLRRR